MNDKLSFIEIILNKQNILPLDPKYQWSNLTKMFAKKELSIDWEVYKICHGSEVSSRPKISVKQSHQDVCENK